MIHTGIFALSLHISAANMNGAQFICSNAPIEDFLFATLRIETPLSILLHQGNGKRPAVGAQLQHRLGIGFGNQVDLLLEAAHEQLPLLSRRHEIG